MREVDAKGGWGVVFFVGFVIVAVSRARIRASNMELSRRALRDHQGFRKVKTGRSESSLARWRGMGDEGRVLLHRVRS